MSDELVPLLEYRCNDFEAWIDVDDDGHYHLGWGDYVANAWDESFANLSSAVARLALLVRCAELRFTVGFTYVIESSDDEKEFTDALSRFYAGVLT